MEPTYATRWFYRALADGAVMAGADLCAVCGLPTHGGEPLGKVLRPTFTDHSVLRCPHSGFVCAACVWYMSRQDVRRQSWWLTATFAQPIERAEMYPLLRAHLNGPPDEDGYYLFTATKRKHLALHAPLNLAGERIRRVRFEVDNVVVDDTFVALLDAAMRLREHHTWQEILHDDYRAHALGRWRRPRDFAEARAVVAPYRKSSQLRFIKFISVGVKIDDTDED